MDVSSLYIDLMTLPWISSSRCSSSSSSPGHVRKLPVTWGSAVVFPVDTAFLNQLQLASHDIAAIWRKR